MAKTPSPQQLRQELAQAQKKIKELEARLSGQPSTPPLAEDHFLTSGFEEKYRTLVEITGTGFVILDSQGHVLDANEEYLRLSGHSGLPEILGRRVTEWTAPWDRQRGAQGLAKCIDEGLVRNLEIDHITPAGVVNHLEINANAVDGTNGPYIMGICRDISARKKSQKDLEHSQTRFRFAANQVADLVYEWDVESGAIEWYGDIDAAVGCGAGEVEHTLTGWLECIHPDDREKVRQAVEQHKTVSEPINYEYRVLLKDGGCAYWVDQASPLLDQDGNPRRWIGVCRDITAQKETENALRLTQFSVDNAALAIYWFTPDWKFTYVNQEACRSLGYTQEELKSLHLMDIDPSITQARCDTFWDRIRGAKMFTLESSHKHKNGETFPVEITSKYLKYGDREVVCSFVSDITSRKKAEAALKHSQKMLRVLINAAPGPVALLDRDLRLQVLNRAAQKQIGLEEPGVMGKPMQQLFPAEVVEARMPYAQRVIESGEPVSFEESLRERRYLHNMYPVLDEAGRTMALAIYMQDVTEIRKNEKERNRLEDLLRQAQKMEALGTLAGGIAHDFNNLLGAISGFSELALDAAEKGVAKAYELGQVIKACKKARELVKEILTFSRKTEVNLRPLNLNEEIVGWMRLLERTIPKMVKIECTLSEDLKLVNGDATQLEQVMLNLAGNAADAMPHGGTLCICTENLTLENDGNLLQPDTPPGEYTLLTVSDTGCGMDQQTLMQIFDPFFTTKGQTSGTGLGLSTVYGIVKSHEGRIVCDSQPGRGATFRIYLPACEPTDCVEPLMEGEAETVGGTETVLLVDDELSLREIGNDILSEAGYTVITASSGEEALEIYGERGSGIDMVMLDVGMPGMGGHKCFLELKKLNPEVRVLIASGYSRVGVLEDIMDGGAAGFVAKPFTINEILLAVRRVLDVRKAG
jgi:two-component system cell cycle sensor histidine kinase/response regulator CckA